MVAGVSWQVNFANSAFGNIDRLAAVFFGPQVPSNQAAGIGEVEYYPSLLQAVMGIQRHEHALGHAAGIPVFQELHPNRPRRLGRHVDGDPVGKFRNRATRAAEIANLPQVGDQVRQ